MAKLTVTISVEAEDHQVTITEVDFKATPCWFDLANLLGYAIRGIDSHLCGEPIDDSFAQQLEDCSGITLFPAHVHTVAVQEVRAAAAHESGQ